MKTELMSILACPVCKGSLELTVQSKTDDEVLAGSLTCAACGNAYPIVEGIPNLLPPELRAG